MASSILFLSVLFGESRRKIMVRLIESDRINVEYLLVKYKVVPQL